MMIKIQEITKSSRAVSAVHGETIYSLIDECFQENEKVELDFSGIELTITAFLNASIGKLYSSYDSTKIKELLTISNLSLDELPLLKFVIESAKDRFGKADDQ